MLRKKTLFSSPNSPTSSSTGSKSPTITDWDADDEFSVSGNMSGDESAIRPATVTLPAQYTTPCTSKRPSLKEILSNTSPPPWTLTAFMAYLSTNHCLETLEFTMDATRYKKHYAKIIAKNSAGGLAPESKDATNIKVLWQRLIQAYIRPNGSREINIPSEVRDPILNLDYSKEPPPPEALDVAVAKVYELMEESVLVPFLNSMSPRHTASPPPGCDCPSETPLSPREEKSKARLSRFGRYSPPASQASGDSQSMLSTSPPPSLNRKSAPHSLTNVLHRHRLSTRLSPTSSATNTQPPPAPPAISPAEPPSAPGLTDDSGYTSSHTNESIMTPPMSPPDSELTLSPRASRDSGTWKKFGRLSQWKPMRKRSQNFKDTESMP